MGVPALFPYSGFDLGILLMSAFMRLVLEYMGVPAHFPYSGFDLGILLMSAFLVTGFGRSFSLIN